jgi:phosphoglycerate dehydrogenase-like enzyme
VVTPHLASSTLDNFANVVARSVENAKAVLRGEPIPINMPRSRRARWYLSHR